MARITGELVVRLALAPALAAMGLAWALIGPMSEEGGEDQMVSLPFIEGHSWVMASIGLLVAAGVAVDLRLNWRDRVPVLGIVGWSAAVGTWLGLLGRVLTAHTTGANIGGGIMLMASTLLIPVLVIVIAAKVRTTVSRLCLD